MKPLVLVAEDNPVMLTFLESYLSERYEVVSKTNGWEALRWLEESPQRPHLIITDVEMPDINGAEMLANIKASSFLKRIPVIILSGKGKSQDRINLLKAGADDYITKPFNPEELELKIDKLLAKTV